MLSSGVVDNRGGYHDGGVRMNWDAQMVKYSDYNHAKYNSDEAQRMRAAPGGGNCPLA
jgi:hypothetical protein